MSEAYSRRSDALPFLRKTPDVPLRFAHVAGVLLCRRLSNNRRHAHKRRLGCIDGHVELAHSSCSLLSWSCRRHADHCLHHKLRLRRNSVAASITVTIFPPLTKSATTTAPKQRR